MTEWLFWGSLLLVQNATFTLVSRARNSQSLLYNAWASLLSNGTWFAAQFILIDKVTGLTESADAVLATATGLFYMVFTMLGSVAMQHIAINRLEKR